MADDESYRAEREPHIDISGCQLFGAPIKRAVDVSCTIGSVVALLFTGYCVARLPWSDLDAGRLPIYAIFLILFACNGVACHLLLISYLKSSSTTTLERARCSYYFHAGFVMTFLFVDVMLFTVLRDRRKGMFIQDAKSPPTSSHLEAESLLRFGFRICVFLCTCVVGVIVYKCNKLSKIKEKQMKEASKKHNQIRHTSIPTHAQQIFAPRCIEEQPICLDQPD